MVALSGAVSLFEEKPFSLEDPDWVFRGLLFLSGSLPGAYLCGAQRKLSRSDWGAEGNYFHRQHVFLSLHQRAGRAGFSHDSVYRTGINFARPGERGTATVFLPAVLPNGICAGQIVGAGRSLITNHVDSRVAAVRDASQPGGRKLGLGESLDRGKPGGFFVALDCHSLAARNGAVGVGEMEDCRWRAAAGRDVLWGRLRAGDQLGAANGVRSLLQSGISDVHRVERVVPGGRGACHSGRRSLDCAACVLCAQPGAAAAQGARLRGDQVSDRIVFEDVSKFYGEILGVNRVNLSIPAGITALVGPNGSGKTTLMNLMTGLVRPSRGQIEVLGYRTNDPENLFKIVGYSTQFDSSPKGLTGFQFVYSYLRLAGRDAQAAERLAWKAIEGVNLTEAATRNVAGYSKGMRQRIRLAQALAHDPKVLVLDEPLNGLDPLARSEMIALFRAKAAQGCYVIISSHILHEVDVISDQVILLSNGYVVAEGQIQNVRNEIQEHPTQIRSE